MKVLSYNIHKGFSQGQNFILDSIRTALRASDPDILFLQEVVGENKKHRDQIQDWPEESQFEFLADEYWPHFAYGKNAITLDRHHGNAILSKFPIVKHENIDLSTNPLEKRGLLHVEVEDPTEAKRLHLFNVHLNLFHSGRSKQIQKVMEHAFENIAPAQPLIFAGDFNDWGEKLSPLLEENLHLKEAFREVRKEHARSFPSFMPMLKLDRIYFKNLRCHDAQVMQGEPWSRLSDHLALEAQFEWKKSDS